MDSHSIHFNRPRCQGGLVRGLAGLSFVLFCAGVLLGDNDEVKQQSDGFVPNVYQPPIPRLDAAPGPYGPPPEAVLKPPIGAMVPTIPESKFDASRGSGVDYSPLLAPRDFFGRAYSPSRGYYDPYDSTLTQDGHPSGPADPPIISPSVSTLDVAPYSFPEVNIAEEVWVTLVLMREGEVVTAINKLPGSEEILQVQRSTDPSSPYLYLRAASGKTEYHGQPLMTTLDLEVEDKMKQVYPYKLKIRVVPADDKSFSPYVRVNLVNSKMPVVYGSSGSKFNEVEKTVAISPEKQLLAQAGIGQAAAGMAPGLAPGTPFTREQTLKLSPIMIGMAKAYDPGVAAGARGYGTTSIQRFQASTVKDGRATHGVVPAFRNPYDGQIYFLTDAFFFPKYDAILYELAFKNTSRDTLYFNYSLLRVIPGFEPSFQAVKPTVISPELGETTPSGRSNILWVLVQGKGWVPQRTPVRFAFPPTGMEGTVRPIVQPHAEGPGGISSREAAQPAWSLTP